LTKSSKVDIAHFRGINLDVAREGAREKKLVERSVTPKSYTVYERKILTLLVRALG